MSTAIMLQRTDIFQSHTFLTYDCITQHISQTFPIINFFWKIQYLALRKKNCKYLRCERNLTLQSLAMHIISNPPFVSLVGVETKLLLFEPVMLISYFTRNYKCLFAT